MPRADDLGVKASSGFCIILLFSLPTAFSIEHFFSFANNLQFIVCDQENWDLCSIFQEQLYFVIEGELY